MYGPAETVSVVSFELVTCTNYYLLNYIENMFVKYTSML